MIFEKIKNFTIIDTETTGLGCYSKLVEFAAIKFRDGKPVASFDTLVNPRMVMSDQVINIHGITNEMVLNAPLVVEASKDIYDFIEDDILVAHNAPFDMDVLNRRLTFGMKNRYIDTLPIFRETLNLYRYNLNYIRKYFQIDIEQTHRALDDVKMLYSCLSKVDKPYNINIKTVDKLIGSCRASQIIKTENLGDQLDSCHCVITGVIPNLSRSEVWQIIVNHGGMVGESVINKTRYLIKGEPNGGQGKLQKAKFKIKNGDNIEIIDYRDFFKLIDTEITK